MQTTLDKFFTIKNILETSDKPLSAVELGEITGLSARTALRYATRLVKENMVEVRVRNTRVYRSGILCYEYSGLGYWESKGNHVS